MSVRWCADPATGPSLREMTDREARHPAPKGHPPLQRLEGREARRCFGGTRRTITPPTPGIIPSLVEAYQ